MQLIAPELTSLYAIPTDGDYEVAGLSSDGKWQRLPPKPRPMSQDQFARFQLISQMLRGLLAMEEAYDVTVGNYLEFEETILRLSAREMAQRRPHGKEDHFDTARRSCHRTLSNLLSASKAFQDQGQRLASSIGGSDSRADLEELKQSLSRAYDASLGYRFMNALRNHAQHYGFSVSGVSMTRAVCDPQGEHPEQYVTTTPYLRLADVKANDSFKASVLAEIEGIAEDGAQKDDRIVPLLPLTRQYMAGLSSVMADIRLLYRERERAALDLIFSAFYHYTGAFTYNYPAGILVTPAGKIDGALTYFGSDDHIKAQSLREVNGELSTLPITQVRQ